MKPRWVLAIITVNLLILAALVFIYPHLMVAPGELIPAHSQIATDCFACHAPLRGVTQEKCASCHAVANIGVLTTRGVPVEKAKSKMAFHRELVEQDCSSCHSDHQGPKLTQRSRKSFSHDLLKTATLERCEACHKPPQDTFHRDLSNNCAQCHSPTKWKPTSFDHTKFFELDRDHNASCVTCHVKNDFKRYTCYGCHEHTPDRIASKHLREGIRDFENCVKCHRSAHDEHGREGGRDGGRD